VNDSRAGQATLDGAPRLLQCEERRSERGDDAAHRLCAFGRATSGMRSARRPPLAAGESGGTTQTRSPACVTVQAERSAAAVVPSAVYLRASASVWMAGTPDPNEGPSTFRSMGPRHPHSLRQRARSARGRYKINRKCILVVPEIRHLSAKSSLILHENLLIACGYDPWVR
jgi:hypothetical protein